MALLPFFWNSFSAGEMLVKIERAYSGMGKNCSCLDCYQGFKFYLEILL